MTFAKPSWLATALVGAESAACVLATTSQTVYYPTPDGPFTADVPACNDRTPFQMTALTTAVGTLLFADQQPLGWLDPGVEIEVDDWPTIAMRTGLNPPETSPVPMGLDVVAPMTVEPTPEQSFADVVTAMEQASGADLSHLVQHPPRGVRTDADETTRIGQPVQTGVAPYAIVLLDAQGADFSNLYLSDDAAALATIADRGDLSLDEALWTATIKMRSTPVDVLGDRTWIDRVAEIIAAAGIPADRVFRGAYL